MCGIVGYINFNVTLQDKRKISSELYHRGPDAARWYENKISNVQFLHRRLSIIDPTAQSNQPFTSRCKRYILLLNGEIYNFQELASKYKLTLATSSDTEVVVELFARRGVEMIAELNGMFAMTIWDTQEEALYLFRDRIGIKPLYYFHEEEKFAFASELKSFALIPKTVSNEAICHYLHVGFIPQPLTIYQNVYKFPSGHYGVFKKGKLKITQYWNVNEKINPKAITHEKDAVSELKNLLLSSIEYRLISDVPLGTFLSGGIDSSTVSAIAQSISNQPINTFSIGFKEKENDESIYSKQIAKYIGSNHHEFILTEDEAIEIIDRLPTMYDEPFADASAIPTFLVSQKTREFVTVALSGDGGDELFMGYGTYDWANRLNNPFIKLGKKGIAYILSRSSKQRNRRAASKFLYPKNYLLSHILSQEMQFFSQKEIQSLVHTNDNTWVPLMTEKIEAERQLSPAEKQAIFDMHYYLKDDLLVKVDRASMANSLEVRVPLLDHRIIEFAMNVGENLKKKQNVRKHLLRQVLFDLIPRSYFDRPKQGFSIPLATWMRGKIKADVDKHLSKSYFEKSGCLNAPNAIAAYNRFKQGEDFFATRIWAIYQLQKWFDSGN